MSQDTKIYNTVPVGSLGLVAHKSSQALGEKVNQYLVDWRNARQDENTSTIAFRGYKKDSLIFWMLPAHVLVLVKQNVSSRNQFVEMIYIF